MVHNCFLCLASIAHGFTVPDVIVRANIGTDYKFICQKYLFVICILVLLIYLLLFIRDHRVESAVATEVAAGADWDV